MSTGISSHLDKMVELLCLEEEEIDSRDPGTVVRVCVCVCVCVCM